MRKTLIFDLGNVIIRVRFDKAIAYWSRELGIEPGALERAFPPDDHFRRFEKGLIGPAEYEAHAAGLIGVAFPDGAFAAGWNAVFGGLMPGVAELATRLRRTCRLVVLTNTNVLHYAVWRDVFKPVAPLFEKVYCSFRIGARKPEPAAFTAVLDDQGLSPPDAVFLDDSEENVRAARGLGLAGIVVSSCAGMAADLGKIGITR